LDLGGYGRQIAVTPILHFRESEELWLDLIKDLADPVRASLDALTEIRRTMPGPWGSRNEAAKSLMKKRLISRSQAHRYIRELLGKQFLLLTDLGGVDVRI
jgi:hypothetical protein